MLKRILQVIFFAGFALSAPAQLVVSADTVLCSPSPVILSVVSAPIFGTEAYTFDTIPYSPEAYEGTAVSMSDDTYKGPYEIGFTFCFMGNSYTKFYIGSNGWVSFGGPGALATTYTSASIPSTSGSVPKNCIMGPWQDWHPGIAGGPYIRYQTIGEAPDRKLVVSWDDVPMFWCTTTYGKFQIVLYETSNIIDNHITNKDYCDWAGGTATQGTHNLAGTIAYVYPGRNSTVWTTEEESVRFTPTGITWTTTTSPDIIGVGDSLTVSPTVTTSYVAHLEDCSGVAYTDTVTVTVATDNADFNYDGSLFCADGTIAPAYIETPGGVFTVEPATIPINAATGVLDIEEAAAGTYYIEYTTPADPCSYTHGESITIVEYPDATIAYADTVFCASGTELPTLITTSGGTFSISPTGSVTVNAVTGSVDLSAAVEGTTYTISYTTAGYCPATSTFDFSIRPFDDASFGYTADSYCPTGTATPTGIVVEDGSFTAAPATLEIDPETGIIDLTSGTPGTTYFITYTTDGGACSSSETVNISIDPLDIATFGYGATSFCAGGSVDPAYITTEGGSFSVEPATLIVDSLSGTIDLTSGEVGAFYNITYTTPDGPCQNSATITISISPNDDSTFAYLDDTFCPFGTALATAIATPGGIFNISPAGLPVNAATGTLNLEGAIPGTYTVTYTTPDGLCSSSSSELVTVEPVIDAYFYYDSAAYCHYGSATPFILNYGGNFIADAGLHIDAANGTIDMAASTPGGPYTVIYNSPGCTEQDTFWIVVHPDPVLTLNFDDLVCIEGDPIVLTATPGGGTFSGSGVSGTAFDPAAVEAPGIYSIHYSYTDSNGCVNETWGEIQVVEHSVFAGDDISIVENNSVQLHADGGVMFEWTPPYGLSCTGCQQPMAQPYVSTVYTVTSFDANGCIATDSVAVTVLLYDDLSVFVPNAFTPNNDGLNDFLFVYGSDIAEIVNFSVFDRWGGLVYHRSNIPPDAEHMGWDGTINGNPAQEGVYAYLIEVRFSFGGVKAVKGNSAVLR